MTDAIAKYSSYIGPCQEIVQGNLCQLRSGHDGDHTPVRPKHKADPVRYSDVDPDNQFSGWCTTCGRWVLKRGTYSPVVGVATKWTWVHGPNQR